MEEGSERCSRRREEQRIRGDSLKLTIANTEEEDRDGKDESGGSQSPRSRELTHERLKIAVLRYERKVRMTEVKLKLETV